VTDARSFVFDRAKTMLEDWKTTRAIKELHQTISNHNRNRNVYQRWKWYFYYG